jgi:putative FmdB family regulatory protein
LPTYEYACTACGHRLEAVQKFSDDPLTECPECGGPLRKVYGAVGIVLKGSGFYKTDSRAASGSNGKNGKGSRSGEAASSGESSSGAESSPKTEKKESSGSDGGSKSEGSGKDSKAAAGTK